MSVHSHEQRILILVGISISMITLTKKEAREHIERQRQRQRIVIHKWYLKNKNWYSKYREKNPEKIREWRERYRKSAKGKEAIRRYEQKPHRKEAKNLWSAKHRLELKVLAGEITEYEMQKRLKTYKQKRGIF